MSACPCTPENAYAQCCQPFHLGDQQPETAEKLMRARYSAYVKGEVDFILNTTHPAKRPLVDPESVQAWSDESEWLGLDIEGTEEGGPGDERGTVTFKAHYRLEETERSHHERSIFSKIDDVWFYEDGSSAQLRREAKVGRNDPCPCESGKKYKKCCGAA
ncbi:YchJ family protein [Acanthopleuribacter pedis]|uniref:YchJ family protein n=1 Tax=Acanthopleuribacter pedis TaxID=442870 RepID=A0A8J7Q2R3_9BACT|nr:YchJ family protein [Acanthopleuribacter pedis]MBO1319492.1 YchJ family protein [Acanthopleuribacter pedis]